MTDQVWRPKVGDYVQIWDWHSTGEDDKITDHGKHGLVVAVSTKTDTFLSDSGKECTLSHIEEGTVFKVLLSRTPKKESEKRHCFDFVHVNQTWLREAKNEQV